MPNVKSLRTSRVIQQKVDQRLAKLEQQSNTQGNSTGAKLKSKRGGNVDVYVEKRVAWPHEAILGDVSRQHIAYDQLSLTQFVQGFSKNILDESDQKICEKMIQYLSELMEDTTDFSWASAKAAHAVLLCEMERGSLDWEQTDKIHRIRRAHAQKYSGNFRQNWAKNEGIDVYGTVNCIRQGHVPITRITKVGGKIFKHICAYCLAQGKQAAHPEKDCKSTNKNAAKKQISGCAASGVILGSKGVVSENVCQVTSSDAVCSSNVFNSVNNCAKDVDVLTQYNNDGIHPNL